MLSARGAHSISTSSCRECFPHSPPTTHLPSARFQLNVRNVQESGRLAGGRAYPDGRGHTFRIINPRVFVFSTTFDL